MSLLEKANNDSAIVDKQKTKGRKKIQTQAKNNLVSRQTKHTEKRYFNKVIH